MITFEETIGIFLNKPHLKSLFFFIYLLYLQQKKLEIFLEWNSENTLFFRDSIFFFRKKAI